MYTQNEIKQTLMSSCEAVKNDKAIKLLEEIAQQLRPINTVEEMRRVLTADEFDTARAMRVRLASLEDCAKVDAEALGYASVAEMNDEQERMPTHQDARVGIAVGEDGHLTLVRSNLSDEADARMRASFLKHVAQPKQERKSVF
jgi:hypothetical protein